MRVTVKHLSLSAAILLAFSTSCVKSKMADIIKEEELAMMNDSTHIIAAGGNEDSKLYLSDILCDIRYIPLETSDSASLSTPVNVKYGKGIYYVSDDEERILCFSSDGTFIRPAYKKGNGHGEVVRMYDYDVDENFLYILDGAKSTLMIYNHEGQFVEEKRLPFRAIRFSISGDGYVFQLAPYGLDDENTDFQIAITDKSFDISATFLKYHIKECKPVTRTPYFSRAYGQVVFAPIYGRSIDLIDTKNDWHMSYYIDFDTPYFEPSKYYDEMKQASEQNILYTYDNPLFDGKYIIQSFTTSHSQKAYLIIDNKTKRHMWGKELVQNLDSVYEFNFLLTKSFSDELNSFIGFANQYYPGIHDDEISEIRQTIDDSIASIIISDNETYADNPILIVYRINPNIK